MKLFLQRFRLYALIDIALLRNLQYSSQSLILFWFSPGLFNVIPLFVRQICWRKIPKNDLHTEKAKTLRLFWWPWRPFSSNLYSTLLEHCNSKGLWTEFGSHVTNMACRLFSQVIPPFHLPLTPTLAPPICTPGLRKELYKDYWPVESTDGKY